MRQRAMLRMTMILVLMQWVGTARAQDVLPFPSAEVKFWINGKEAAEGTVQRTVPGTFTASETFDIGRDTCSPVADAYFDKAPFPSRERSSSSTSRTCKRNGRRSSDRRTTIAPGEFA